MDTRRRSRRGGRFPPAAPQRPGTRLRLHKPLLGRASGEASGSVTESRSAGPDCPALTPVLARAGAGKRGPGPQPPVHANPAARRAAVCDPASTLGAGAGPGLGGAPDAAPCRALTCCALTCRGPGWGAPRGPGAPRPPRGAVRRRPVLKAASLRRGLHPGQGLRAAAARRQRRPPGWPRCPWRRRAAGQGRAGPAGGSRAAAHTLGAAAAAAAISPLGSRRRPPPRMRPRVLPCAAPPPRALSPACAGARPQARDCVARKPPPAPPPRRVRLDPGGLGASGAGRRVPRRARAWLAGAPLPRPGAPAGASWGQASGGPRAWPGCPGAERQMHRGVQRRRAMGDGAPRTLGARVVRVSDQPGSAGLVRTARAPAAMHAEARSRGTAASGSVPGQVEAVSGLADARRRAQQARGRRSGGWRGAVTSERPGAGLPGTVRVGLQARSSLSRIHQINSLPHFHRLVCL